MTDKWDQVTGFSMNKDKLFFWNDFEIWYYDLRFEKFTEEWKKLSLNVDRGDLARRIKFVRTGPGDDKVAVIVKQTKGSYYNILWSTTFDSEIEAFDHGLHPNIFWD